MVLVIYDQLAYRQGLYSRQRLQLYSFAKSVSYYLIGIQRPGSTMVAGVKPQLPTPLQLL